MWKDKDMFDNLSSNYRSSRSTNSDNYYGSEYLFKPTEGKINKVLDARFYVTRSGGTVYCRAWLNIDCKHYASGMGKAGGWGYDRESSAFVDALADMGIDKEKLHKAGVQGGIGMNAALEKFKELLPDSDKLVRFVSGS